MHCLLLKHSFRDIYATENLAYKLYSLVNFELLIIKFINNFFLFKTFINSPATNSKEVNFSTFLSENKLNENYKKKFI